ncbi:MAG: hypothetical protein EU551_04555, partial [Promethearchaeota archaeon]
MRDAIFSSSNEINDAIILKIKDLNKIIENLIDESEILEEYYQIWKKVGNRISDKDYTSSKQQVKKKNPTEQKLKRIFSTEIVIALIVRSLAAIKIFDINSDNFNGIEIINKYFNDLKKSKSNFLFQDDFYNIWAINFLKGDMEQIDQFIGTLLPEILKLLRKQSPKQIFLTIHQNILDLDLRKILGEIYTPPEISKLISHWVYHYLESKDSVIDLSCGVGILLSDFIEKCKKMEAYSQIKKVIGIDINPLSTLICKFILIYDDLENLQNNKISEPLVFCADSLISYANLRNSRNKIEFKIEFIGDNYDIAVDFVGKDLIGLRKILSDEINKNLNKEPSKIRLPDRLKTILKSNLLKKYFKSLLIERICAVFALNSKYDAVLGNPPYLRVQSIQPLWRREILKQKYQSAFGHFDIYYLFIELGINLLSEIGILGYVSSNKFMSTTAGSRIRDYISKNTTIKNLIDFNDSHIFEARVLPAIYILSRKKRVENFLLTSMKKIKSEEFKKIDTDDFLNYMTNTKEIDGIYKINSKPPIILDRFQPNQP